MSDLNRALKGFATFLAVLILAGLPTALIVGSGAAEIRLSPAVVLVVVLGLVVAVAASLKSYGWDVAVTTEAQDEHLLEKLSRWIPRAYRRRANLNGASTLMVLAGEVVLLGIVVYFLVSALI